MSMNLHCDEVDLWQTPTYVTYMCYNHYSVGEMSAGYNWPQPTEKEKSSFKVKADNWISIRERYILWCQMHIQDHCNYLYGLNTRANIESGLYTGIEINEMVDNCHESLRAHIELLRSFKKLHFRVL